jgi:hypothetical protein
MCKTFGSGLFFLSFLFFSLIAAGRPQPAEKPWRHYTIPVSYSISNKPTLLYLSNACSGMVNDAVAGEGVMAVSVLGTIRNGQLSVQIKVDYKGKASTTVENISYAVKSSLSASDTKSMFSEPVDIFVKGHFRLEAKNDTSSLFINDIGYITIYPDGSVADHILDPRNDPGYSHPKIYCRVPAS